MEGMEGVRIVRSREDKRTERQRGVRRRVMSRLDMETSGWLSFSGGPLGLESVMRLLLEGLVCADWGATVTVCVCVAILDVLTSMNGMMNDARQKGKKHGS